MTAGHAQLELTLSGAGSPRTSAVPLPAAGAARALEGDAEELSVEVLEADERVLHLRLRTSMTISYDGEREILGPGVAEASSPATTMPTAWGGSCVRARPTRPPPLDASDGPRRKRERGSGRWRTPAAPGPRRAATTSRRWRPGGDAARSELWTRLGAEEGTADRRPSAAGCCGGR